MTKIKGSCLCGQVTYHSDANPAVQIMCHCPDCQKQTGTAFSVNVLVPTASIVFKGESRKQYVVTGDSGKPVVRNFCGNCGSPLSTEMEGFGNLAAVKAATLEDDSWVKPEIQIWTDSAKHYGTPNTELKHWPRNPAF
jgi:hypothetical protein